MKKKKAAILFAMALLGTSCHMTAFAAYTDQDTVKSVQEALNEKGYDCGTPDGLFGSKTGEAIGNFQESNGLEVSGEIDDALLAALGISDQGGAQGDSADTAEFQNEAAWETLYDALSQNGMAIDGMKGFFKGSDNYHTTIGVKEGDTDTIYLYTKGDYGESGAQTVTDLTIALKKNQKIAAFTATSDLELSVTGIDMYTKEVGSGQVEISSVTARTELAIEQYSNETLDINGNTNTTTDVSECKMSGTMAQSLEHLLTDTEQILKDNTSLEMKDLGFYTGLDNGLTLGDNEIVKKITDDVYAVFPKDWKEVDNKTTVNYYPPEAGEDKATTILYSISPISGDLSAYSRDELETFLDAGFSSFNKNGFVITEERKDIEIAGFEARSADIVRSDSGTNYVVTMNGFLADNNLVMIGIMQRAGAETDYSGIYQRLIDSIFVDASGTIADSLNGSQDTSDTVADAGDGSQETSDTVADAADGSQETSDAADENQDAADGMEREETEEDSNVLLDNEVATVSYVERTEGSNYIGAKLLIENKTEDKTIMAQADNTSVNGYMQYMSLDNSTVSPGMKTYAELKMYTSDAPITTPDEYVNVEGILKIWYNEDGGNSYSDSCDPVSFGILKDDKASDELVSGLRNSQEILLDNDEITIGYLDTFEEDQKFGAKILVENKTEQKTIMVNAENTAIDGFMTYLHLNNSVVSPGKVAVCELTAGSDNEVAQSLEQFVNVTGTWKIWCNEDGGSSYSSQIEGDNFKILGKE